MKKLLLILISIISIAVKAQITSNWDSVAVAGIKGTDTTVQFTVFQKFNNKLYVGGNSYNYLSGFDQFDTLKMFSSPTGNIGTYTILPHFTSLGSSNLLPTSYGAKLNSSTANSNYMFLGSGVASNSTITYPQVYRMDVAENFSNIGPSAANYASLPADNTVSPANNGNPQIDALAQFSPTGSNDTIYAFVNPNDYGSHMLSVWKAPVNTTTPVWKNSTNFTIASGISKVYDAIVWHNRLYIAVNRIDSTDVNAYAYKMSSILSTADGVNWDTVAKTNTLLTSLEGYYNSYNNYAFTALEIHNDTLIAGINDAAGGLLWGTTDNSAHPTWFNMYNNSDQYIPNLVDLQSDGFNIWVETNTSGSYTRILQYNTYIKSQSLVSLPDVSVGTDLANNSNSNAYKMQFFNNALYTSGYLSSPNYPYSNGNIWRLFIPKASIKDSLSPNMGYCTGDTLFLKNKSTNALSYNWIFNNGYGNVGITKDTLLVLSNPGTYSVKLNAYSGVAGSLGDSISETITVYGSPNVSTLSTSPSNICAGQTDTVKTNVVSLIPYTSTWTLNSTLTYTSNTNQVIITPPAGTYSLAVTVKDTNKCVGISTATATLVVHQNNSLSGLIKEPSGNAVTVGKAYLFEKKTTNVGHADTISITNLGSYPINTVNYNYTFPTVPIGNYYVKIVADTLTYPQSVGTYYSFRKNRFQWDSALAVAHPTCTAANDTANINLIEIVDTTGPGSISGNIRLLSSFGQRLANGTNSTYGVPLKGCDVKLGKNPGGGCAARTTATTTMTAGSNVIYTYRFDSVPLGSYKIYVDIPNFGMDSARVASISSTDTASINNNYFVDSTTIHVDTAHVLSGIFKQSAVNSSVKVYPNPAADVAYIDFENNAQQNVNLQLYDITGKQITILYNNKMPRGKQTVMLNLAELQLNKGVYFIRATINGAIQTLKLTIINN